jgi:sulfate/thiosulfate-binding protein
MVRSALYLLLAIYLLGSGVWLLSSGVVRESSGKELLNVACDPTRELWKDLNPRFCNRYEQEHGVRINIQQSHGGSASQARQVMDGLEADVVTLALWSDTDAIRKAGLMEPGWENKLENRSLPFTSTIVFVVRRNNPKDIHDWADLTKRDDIRIVVPNPKTSGNGKWAFLAAYGSVLHRKGTVPEAEEAVRQLFARTSGLDPAARGATETFAKKGIGDVHLTWENEAYLEVLESKGELEIVYPKVSVQAEPHVAVVDANARKKGTEAVAKAYLEFLYTKEAQEVIAKHYYRPTNPAIKKQTADRFPAIELFAVTPLIAPSWDEIQTRFFNRDGLFDRIYTAGGGGAE